MSETKKEKENRIFIFYRADLVKLAKEEKQLRFNVVEYICSFPQIDPYKMSATLMILDGMEIVYDDASISIKENEKKHKKVLEEVKKKCLYVFTWKSGTINDHIIGFLKSYDISYYFDHYGRLIGDLTGLGDWFSFDYIQLNKNIFGIIARKAV